MGLFEKLERGIDRGVSSVFSRANAPLKPLDLAQGLRRECDDQIQVLDRSRTLAPNVYMVYLHSQDYDRFVSWEETLTAELERVLTDHANRQQYMFVGPLSVSLERDDEVPAGNFETESRTERGAAATVTAAAHNQRITPILEIDSQQYLLTGDVTVIGRGENADIILEDTGVSRDHVEFRVVSDGLVVTDLGSTNGTYVNGSRITTPVDISDGAIVKIGRTVITVTLRDGNGSEW
ncbi:FhaA domain-containing protein [Dermabacteraceae bacterium P13115]|nr:DUF3662 and FHA domain-containing protein [Dermabacteraceae bacterium TAE3-ERU27]MBV7432875.1 DUF3662 and FHA domain-containing protein [Dermabacteraceae bacterium TAE3-ERU5]